MGKRTKCPRCQRQERWDRQSYIDMLPQMFRRIERLETELSELRAQVNEIYRISRPEKRSVRHSQPHLSLPLRQDGSNRSLSSLSPQAKIERSLVLLSDALREIDTWEDPGAVSQL